MRTLRPFLVLLFAMALVGCATINPFPNVTVYGSSIKIYRVIDSQTADGVPEVVVSGASAALNDRSARYRAVWFDQQSRPIETVVSTWTEMTLQAERPFNLRMVGPGAHARRYQVEIEVL